MSTARHHFDLKPSAQHVTRRLRLQAWGGVQGVGFRPFIYRLAVELGLNGNVSNSPQGATIEVQGQFDVLELFQARIWRELPSPAFLCGLEATWLDPTECEGFRIKESSIAGSVTAEILPDISTCKSCLAEIQNPRDKRFSYPFTNCTHCGPRYSIIASLPYDRPMTSMAGFTMCSGCSREYEDPLDRRFHAQPIACPECGPQLELWNSAGVVTARRQEALEAAAVAIRNGQIVAVKGIGGFHLVVLAQDQNAVQRLRQRKYRYAKPMAVMTRSLEEAQSLAAIDASEELVLTGPAGPIVLLRATVAWLSEAVSPESPTVGIMLPYSPLHHMLVNRVGAPIVATSGNLSEEPICTDEAEAVSRFKNVADLILVHDRPILRPVDDSVVRIMPQGTMIVRRARGFAPLSIPLAKAEPGVLSVGGHMKSSVAISLPGAIVVGQHVGDLDNLSTRVRMEDETQDLARLFNVHLNTVVHDNHPDYASTIYARTLDLKSIGVQHHLAHAAGCMAENDLAGPALAVCWDGTGYGMDGTVWGGEFLAIDGSCVERVAHLRPFLLPGGEIAAREGWRAAFGVLYEALGLEGLRIAEGILQESDNRIGKLLKSGVRCVQTTSAGRLFDAVAAIAAGIEISRFEGDAAMRFESLATQFDTMAYPIAIRRTDKSLQLDWVPMITSLCESDESPALKAMRVHMALSEGIVQVAQIMGVKSVVLTGGCFQNKLLTRLTWDGLLQAGFRPYGHQRIPPNDGGLAFGQIVVAGLGLMFGNAQFSEGAFPCA